jgi:hypothetical protein
MRRSPLICFPWQPSGVEKILPIGDVTEYEKGLIAAALPDLETNIEKVRKALRTSCPVLTFRFVGGRVHHDAEVVSRDIPGNSGRKFVG